MYYSNKEKGQLNPWQPSDMLYSSPVTADKFAEEYDRYGDSFTQDATVESLQEAFKNVQSQVTVLPYFQLFVSQTRHIFQEGVSNSHFLYIFFF